VTDHLRCAAREPSIIRVARVALLEWSRAYHDYRGAAGTDVPLGTASERHETGIRNAANSATLHTIAACLLSRYR